MSLYITVHDRICRISHGHYYLTAPSGKLPFYVTKHSIYWDGKLLFYAVVHLFPFWLVCDRNQVYCAYYSAQTVH